MIVPLFPLSSWSFSSPFSRTPAHTHPAHGEISLINFRDQQCTISPLGEHSADRVTGDIVTGLYPGQRQEQSTPRKKEEGEDMFSCIGGNLVSVKVIEGVSPSFSVSLDNLLKYLFTYLFFHFTARLQSPAAQIFNSSQIFP